MGNLVSTMVHCQKRASEAIVGANSHVFLFEQGMVCVSDLKVCKMSFFPQVFNQLH